MNPWILMLLGWLIMAAIMHVTWIRATRTSNAGTVDVVWTFGLGGLALFYALSLGGEWSTRRTVILALVLIWSLRLGVHLYRRVSREPEDGRYHEIRSKWGNNTNRNLLWFFQFQAFLDSFLSLAFMAAFLSVAPFGSITDIAAIAIVLIAVAGETIADAQLTKFRSDPENAGKTCRVGLWRYSRHPNYFFEWLYWWAFPLLAVGSSWALLSIISPLAMLYLILKVTGIPPTEKQALRKRGDDYRSYQQETSAFFPWFPKRNLSLATKRI